MGGELKIIVGVAVPPVVVAKALLNEAGRDLSGIGPQGPVIALRHLFEPANLAGPFLKILANGLPSRELVLDASNLLVTR